MYINLQNLNQADLALGFMQHSLYSCCNAMQYFGTHTAACIHTCAMHTCPNTEAGETFLEVETHKS